MNCVDKSVMIITRVTRVCDLASFGAKIFKGTSGLSLHLILHTHTSIYIGSPRRGEVREILPTVKNRNIACIQRDCRQVTLASG